MRSLFLWTQQRICLVYTVIQWFMADLNTNQTLRAITALTNKTNIHWCCTTGSKKCNILCHFTALFQLKQCACETQRSQTSPHVWILPWICGKSTEAQVKQVDLHEEEKKQNMAGNWRCGCVCVHLRCGLLNNNNSLTSKWNQGNAAGGTGVIHNLLSSTDVTTEEAGNTKGHYLLQGEKKKSKCVLRGGWIQ